jgi:hypothetical protein
VFVDSARSRTSRGSSAVFRIRLLLSNPRESKIDSGGRLEDGQVESGTGDIEVSADLFNPVSRSAAPQTSYFYEATRRRAVFGVA